MIDGMIAMAQGSVVLPELLEFGPHEEATMEAQKARLIMLPEFIVLVKSDNVNIGFIKFMCQGIDKTLSLRASEVEVAVVAHEQPLDSLE